MCKLRCVVEQGCWGEGAVYVERREDVHMYLYVRAECVCF